MNYLAGAFRLASYALVFYSGSAIGSRGADAGIAPFWAFIGTALLAAAARATHDVYVLKRESRR